MTVVESPEEKFATLIKKLQKKEVKRIEVLHIRNNIRSIVNFKYFNVENSPSVKLVLEGEEVYVYSSEFLEVFNSFVVESTDEDGDIRWGIIFYYSDGTRLAIFVAAGSDIGVVDKTPVTYKFLKGDFTKWLGKFSARLFEVKCIL